MSVGVVGEGVGVVGEDAWDRPRPCWFINLKIVVKSSFILFSMVSRFKASDILNSAV